MKNAKKALVFLFVVALLTAGFSACGNSEVVTDEPEANETDSTTNTDSGEEFTEDMAEITMMILSLGPQGEGAVAVENAVNAISEKEINVHVNLKYVEVGNYSQQLNLAIAGDEDVDICHVTPIPPAGFTALTAQKALMPITEYVNEYAPETLDLLGDLIKGTSINGEVYSLPVYRDLSQGAYIMMRKDMLEELGILDQALSITSWSEFEEIAQLIGDNYDMAVIGNNNVDGTILTMQGNMVDADSFADGVAYDSLGDIYKIIAVGQDGNVYNYFESDGFKTTIERVRRWYENGWVYQDAATSDIAIDELLKNNLAFSIYGAGELGIEANHSALAGHELVAVKVMSNMITTNNITKFGWAVPTCAKDPEAAVKFLNLMYTNPEINNLLAWGIEGTDYVVEDGIAKFPEGVTSESVAYHTSDFLYGNQFATYPWEGSPEGIRETALEEMENAPLSKYLGFSCDTTSVANELTAISNVIAEYAPGIESGSLPVSTIDDFIAKLKEAGVDKVIELYQNQLDAWLAEQ